MKRATWVWLGSTAMALALLATASWADVPERGEPVDPADQTISIAGVSQELSPSLDGARSGAARLTINGESYEVTILSDPLVLADGPDNFGNLVGTMAHFIDFGNGNTVSTVDEMILTPTVPGWFQVAGKMTITGGTGIFSNIRGLIDVEGLIQLDGPGAIALSLMEGTITL